MRLLAIWNPRTLAHTVFKERRWLDLFCSDIIVGFSQERRSSGQWGRLVAAVTVFLSTIRTAAVLAARADALRGNRLPVSSVSRVAEGASCYRGNHQHFVPILECVLLVAEEANVFLVDVEIDEAAHLSGIVAQVRAQSRESGFDLGN